MRKTWWTSTPWNTSPHTHTNSRLDKKPHKRNDVRYGSAKNVLDQMAMHVGQSPLDAIVIIREPLVIDA